MRGRSDQENAVWSPYENIDSLLLGGTCISYSKLSLILDSGSLSLQNLKSQADYPVRMLDGTAPECEQTAEAIEQALSRL